MIVQYDETTRFRKTDDLNWNLERYYAEQKGKDGILGRWRALSYHMTLGRACKELALNIADEGESTSLRGYARELKAIGEQIALQVEKVLRGVLGSEEK